MFGLFENISDFFAGIFSSDPHLIQARKALRGIYETIQNQRPLIYQKTTNHLTPAFALAYYNLFGLMSPLMDLFDRTINNKDKKIRDLSLQFYIESSLVGDIAQRRLGLNYEAIKNRLINAPNFGQETTRINTDFNNLMADVKKQITPNMEQEIFDLIALKNLVMHNISGFFKKFGFDLAEYGKKKPSFVSVEADNLVPELLDLYYVLAGIKSIQVLGRPLTILLERLSPHSAEEQSKKITKLLEKIETLLRTSCSPILLLNVIKAIRKDPDFKSEIAKGEGRYLQDYVEQMNSKFIADRDRCLREISEDSLTKDLNALFGQAPLLSFRGYDASDNERLIGAGLDPFTHVKALSILISFSEAVLKKFWLDTIKNIVVDAFWVEKEYGTSFGNQFYALAAFFKRQETLEKSLFSEEKASHTTLEKHLKRDNINVSAGNRVVEAINKVVVTFVEAEVEVLFQMGKLVADILNDYKNPSPEYISNIKSLGGKNNREIVQGLLEGYNKTSQLIKIMKNFVVIKAGPVNP